ncbi:MAG: hypothetical protein PGN23_10465 [Sphingomonas adhaesiva]|uniref:hypothetical protein n=1 Tax=Sphingomonas adhaesiva TaxID=28212 RepID=UPI002FF70AD3
MTIALLLALVQAAALPAASIDGLPLGALPQQALPAKGCAAYLFTTGETRVLAAMVTADPGSLRVALDGKVADYPRIDGTDGRAATLGFTPEARFAAGDVSATLDMRVEQRATLGQGAAVPTATLRIDRAGRDTIVVPMAGLVGCSN